MKKPKKRGYTVVHPKTGDETLPYAKYADAQKYAVHLSGRYKTAVEIRKYPHVYPAAYGFFGMRKHALLTQYKRNQRRMT